MKANETAAELIAAWDRGEPIVTIDMGGFGERYEAALQEAAVEMARDGIASVWRPSADHEANINGWREIARESARKHSERLGGLTGAMFGAASWLAYQWVHNGGPAKLIDRATADDKSDRVIVVRKPTGGGA